MLRLLPVCLLGALLCGCDAGIVAPAGPVGKAERLILFNSLAIMLTVVIPTIVATFVFAWWFRASNPKARYRPDWDFSGRLELITWSAFGSHITMSASLPTARAPLRGYSPNSLAGVVETSSTKRFSPSRPSFTP